MQIKNSLKVNLVAKTIKAIERGESLYSRFVINGGYLDNDEYRPLMNPDRRDAAEFIFFEVAARYECFCCEALRIEIRKNYNVKPKTATFIMGSSDKGLVGVMGWTAPKNLQNRAEHLLGKKGFFALMLEHLEKDVYDSLTYAHKVRNRIAHGGDRSSDEFRKILHQLQVPSRSRKGLCVGRLLAEYPENAQIGDRWFNRFMGAYKAVVTGFDSCIKLPN